MKAGWRIVGFAFVLRFLFLMGVPEYENRNPHSLSAFNDERAHFNYVMAMAKSGKRPIQTHSLQQSYPLGIYDFEYYQSPLFYTLAGRLYSILPEFLHNIYSVRFINIILGLLIILTLGRMMLMFSGVDSISTMVFLSALGSSALFNATVTNDSLLWLFSALSAYFGLSLLSERSLRNLLGLSLSLSFAIWAKMSGLVLLPAAIFAYYSCYSDKKIQLRIGLTLGWTVFVFILTAPLFYQNYQYYHSLIPMSVGSGEPQPLSTAFAPQRVFQTINYLVHSFYFPFENHWMGSAQVVIFLLMGAVSLPIIYFGCRYMLKMLKRKYDWERKAGLFLGLMLIGGLGGLGLMVIRYNQTEARHAFAALPAICFLMINGIRLSLGAHEKQLPRLALLLPAIPYILFIIH